jgi:hypothetical protein
VPISPGRDLSIGLFQQVPCWCETASGLVNPEASRPTMCRSSGVPGLWMLRTASTTMSLSCSAMRPYSFVLSDVRATQRSTSRSVTSTSCLKLSRNASAPLRATSKPCSHSGRRRIRGWALWCKRGDRHVGDPGVERQGWGFGHHLYYDAWVDPLPQVSVGLLHQLTDEEHR